MCVELMCLIMRCLKVLKVPFLGTPCISRVIPHLPFKCMLGLIKTQCKMEVRILSGGVPKNLTFHGMSKIDFQPEFWNSQMLSFPNM